ncbi:DegT/DnrJ/EryC1/StrS aminotransferase family protein [Candidatus Daviesbacteria bacterium]|nr:DegT/DnrJ/EryC1/StrS aminotransferase family protein [Candidatus Daviesbacteria bacterium]
MIPVSKPIIPKNAERNLLECLKTGWVSSVGPFINLFEESFAKYLGISFAITSTSGTASLHLALAALNIGKGDEVIVPTFTMIAPVFAVLYVGAKPVLVDSDLDTWNMDTSLIEKKITKKTKAILVVHIYGHPADLKPILALAKKYGLFIIEDAAESLGSEYQGKKVGTFGDVACFSFYANKTITTGEGGMVVTNNKKLAKRLRLLKDMAHSPKKRFLHTEVAFTYRMTNMQAALGLAQMEIIDKIIEKKRSIAKFYHLRFSKLPSLTLPPEKAWAKNVYWMYGILVKDRDKIRSKLKKQGIDTRDFFIPMHQQVVLAKLNLIQNKHYPVADYLSKHGLYLPSGPNLIIEEQKKVCQALEEVI